jgi:PAS domain S-box-containing protein/putative nucleotidyltransferase with HDIG domain
MQRDAKVLGAYLLDLLDSMPDASLVVDSTGSIVLANVLAEKMFGYGRQELKGKSIGTLIPERFRDVHAGHCSDYFSRPRTRAMGVGLSLHALRKDGAELPVEISLSPIETNEGTFVVGAIRDISQSEERYRAIFEQVAVGVVHSNSEGQILNVNPKFCEISGYAREEALTLDIRGLTHADDIGKSLEARTSMLAGGSLAYEREVRLIRKDRSVIWTHITTSLVRGASGRPLHFISVIQDISAEKRAEAELRESEERFRAMIEQSISGTCIIDAERRLVYVNPRLAGILGYESAGSLTGRPVLELVASQDHALVAENMRQRLAGEAQSMRYHFQAIRRDGARVTLGAHGTAGWYDGKRVVIATVQDVTELRRAEEEIERTVAKFRRALQSTIEVVSTIGELRDPYTHGHEHRVGEIATAIAKEMDLSADRVEGVRVAGYLHDVGKIAVPAEILSKPTRLSKAEFELVKQHAQQSYEILKGVEFPWPVAEAAWQHHERLDGSGYPRGLKGEEIILEARILAVADTTEAMASHRPYRPGLGIDAALAELERNRGTLYDPEIVDACLRLFRVIGYELPA